MKNCLSKLLIFSLLICFLVPFEAEGKIVEIKNPLKANDFWELLANIINFLFYLSLPVAALMIVVAAFFFLGSAGEPEKITTAKNIIIYTIVGVIVLFLSMAIADALQNMLGVKVIP